MLIKETSRHFILLLTLIHEYALLGCHSLSKRYFMTFFFWNISIILSYFSGSSEFIEHETGHSLLCSLKQDCPFDRDVIFIIPIRKIIQYHNGIHMWKQLPLIVPEAVFRCNFIHKIMVKRRKFLPLTHCFASFVFFSRRHDANGKRFNRIKQCVNGNSVSINMTQFPTCMATQMGRVIAGDLFLKP